MPYYAGVQEPRTAEFGIVIRSYNRRPNRKNSGPAGYLPPITRPQFPPRLVTHWAR